MQYNKNTYCSQALIWSIFAVSKERALVMIPSESPSQRQTTEAATHNNMIGSCISAEYPRKSALVLAAALATRK